MSLADVIMEEIENTPMTKEGRSPKELREEMNRRQLWEDEKWVLDISATCGNVVRKYLKEEDNPPPVKRRRRRKRVQT